MPEDAHEDGQEPSETKKEEGKTGGQEPKTFDETYVKKLRDEAAAARTALRESQTKVKENAEAARKWAEKEDGEKTELEKANKNLADAEKRATDAESRALRMEVALDKAPDGMSTAQIRKLSGYFSGASREEIEESAADVFTDFLPAAKSDDEDEGDKPASRRRPQERLRPGAAPGKSDDDVAGLNPDQLAARVPRM